MRAMQMFQVFFALAVVCLAMGPLASQAVPAVVKLPKFSSVRICAPFGAVITPGTVPSLSLDADQAVKNAVTTSIDAAGVLTIGTSVSFESTNPVKLKVILPATSLRGVEVNSPVTAQVTVVPGFKPAKAFQASVSGAGNLFLEDLTVDTLTLNNNGAGQLYVKGGAMSASVSANGAGTTYLGGGNIGQVTVNVGGVGQVVIDPKNADTSIIGSTQLLGKIMYTSGSCSLSGSTVSGVTDNPAVAAVSQLLGTNPFGQLTQGSCTRVAASPVPVPKAMFTCGLRVQGVFDCSGNFAGGSSTSTSGNGGTITSNSGGGTSTSTSGNGVAFASGGNGPGQSISSGPGQSATLTNNGAVQTLPCGKKQ